MHKRPKKHTPSDINRNNVNLNVALEQLPEYKAIPDFTIVSYEQYLKDKDEIERGYEEGDPNTPWETYTEKEESPLFNRNRKLLDKSELKKISKHPLWRNRDQARYPYDELNEKTQKIISSFEDKLIQVDDFKNIPQKSNYKRSETAQE
eukprot:gene7475-8063_t